MARAQILIDPLEVRMMVELAALLRSDDPERRAECSEHLVRALDRSGYALETLLANCIVGPPPKGSKPSCSAPMGQKNWMSYIRFLLQSPLIGEWETEFLKNIQTRSSLSPKQKNRLWQILHKVYPAGCGRWGKPPAI
jgi:hypothetical protein